ncbi:MAG: hypothetical protein HeimC2_00290 [Candidatus Heimdallarchaeota archaeon LC_2]|nr:MAG: hypothetical protein HeimC2_00290 [Candidatus Heimdallarchaeota archaeon LC_2]
MSEPHIGHGFEEKHWKKINKESLPGEQILGIFNYGKKRFIIITSLFFINWKRGFYIEKTIYASGPYKRMPYGLIRNPKISDDQPNSIELSINSRVVKFKDMNLNDIPICIEMINKMISEVPKLHIGRTVTNKQHDQAIKNFIESDEHLLGIFNISMKHKSEMKQYFLFITSKKIARWAKGLMSRDLILYDYNTIIKVESKKGAVAGDLILHFSGHNEVFQNMGKNEGVIAAEIIQNQITKTKNQFTNVTQIGSTNSFDNVDPLKIIQARYAKGEISKKEFDQLLNDLQKSKPKKILICKACGSENNPESGFCISCGIALE